MSSGTWSRAAVLAIALCSANAMADPPSIDAAAAERDAQAARHAAEQASRHVLTLLDRSRLDGDRERAQCFDGALTQIDSFGRMIDERHERLRAALHRGDPREVQYQRSVIARLLEQLRALEHGTSSCFDPQSREG